MRPWLAVLIGVISQGCEGVSARTDVPAAGRIGPPADPSEVDYASGTRLRARVAVSSSGARMHHDWLDLATGQDCYFGLASDDKPRCLPKPGSFTFYIDDACSRLAVPSSEGSVLPRMVSLASGCTATVYALGPSRAVAGFYLPTETGCQETAKLGEKQYARELQAVVDPSEFVAADVVREPRGVVLGMQFLQAEDGSRQPYAPFDLHLGVCCDEHGGYPHRQVDRCVPLSSGLVAQGTYTDSTCKKPAVQPFLCPRAVGARFAEIPPKAYCEVDPVAVVPLDDAPPTPRFVQADGQCQASQEMDAGPYVVPGEPIPFESLPILTHSHALSADVEADWLLSPEGNRLLMDYFYDNQRGEHCIPARAVDCTLRCIPVRDWRYAGSIDSACSVPGFLERPDDTCAGQPLPLEVAHRLVSTPCKDHVTRLLRRGSLAPSQDTVFVEGCLAVGLAQKADIYEATEIPPTEFPELQEATE